MGLSLLPLGGRSLHNEPIVYIVDDDPGARASLSSLVHAMPLEIEAFHSAEEFLDFFDPMQSGCLLLDLRGGGVVGLELLERINTPLVCLPAVVMSASRDARHVVRAMRAGAIDFLQKPCRKRAIREAIEECLRWDAANRRRLVLATKVSRRLERLAQGEYDVLTQIMAGKSNKGIADALGLSVRAVEVRRSKLMKKMKADSLVALIRMALLSSMPDDENCDNRTTGQSAIAPGAAVKS
jgi:FixJ family two-component response regulator